MRAIMAKYCIQSVIGRLLTCLAERLFLHRMYKEDIVLFGIIPLGIH